MIVAYITVAICLDLIDSLRNIITEKERERHTHTHTYIYIYIQTYIIHNIIICFFCFISFTRSFIRRHVRLWPQLLNQSTLVPTSSNIFQHLPTCHLWNRPNFANAAGLLKIDRLWWFQQILRWMFSLFGWQSRAFSTPNHFWSYKPKENWSQQDLTGTLDHP